MSDIDPYKVLGCALVVLSALTTLAAGIFIGYMLFLYVAS